LTAPEWERFCRLVLDRPDIVHEERFASPASRFENRAELDVLIGTSFSRLSGAELVERLEDAGIPYGQPRRLARVANHPELRARRRWLGIRAGDVEVQVPATPLISAAFDAVIGDAPVRGSATEAIRAEFGGGQ
jgi:crotonobetainyl-CoA:carnitine CoA-transferase CaiB-like acyl-CoA transferase